jgi:kynurenine formamidase
MGGYIQMKHRNNLSLVALIALFLNSVASFSAENHVLDLTYAYNNNTIYWPTEKGFKFEKLFYGMTSGGYFYSAFKFCTPEHGGTHMDAPRHFSKHGLTVDQIPVEQLLGQAVVIHVDDKVKSNSDYAITVDDIQRFEKKYRPLNQQDIVLFYTGWGKRWGNKKQYLGSDQWGDISHLHFPGISKEAAQYLVGRKIKGLGIDTASMDVGNSHDFWTHRIILGANIYGIENVAHLELLPIIGAQLIVAPMKIEGGSGGPTRVLALY